MIINILGGSKFILGYGLARKSKQSIYAPLVFGMHHVYLTQAENGELPSGVKPTASHYSDLLALDCAGEDSGIDFWFNKSGYWICLGRWGNAGTTFFGSCDNKGDFLPVHCADGVDRIVTIALTHSKLKYTTGNIYTPEMVMYQEGTAGFATGNHIHIEVGIGWQVKKYKINRHYRLRNALKPSDVFFLKRGWHTVVTKGVERNWKWVD